MAYHQVYITDALVCTAKDSNTSDRSYLLFTKDAGMLWANAKSVREERSKHRYALQEFSLIRASLVRGKSGWRITGTEPITNLYFETTSREARTLVRNIIRLLRRFLHGESPVPRVFEDVVASRALAEAKADTLETVFTLRMLHELGYVAADTREHIIEAETLAHAYEAAEVDIAKRSEKIIADALAVSHL